MHHLALIASLRLALKLLVYEALSGGEPSYASSCAESSDTKSSQMRALFCLFESALCLAGDALCMRAVSELSFESA